MALLSPFDHGSYEKQPGDNPGHPQHNSPDKELSGAADEHGALREERGGNRDAADSRSSQGSSEIGRLGEAPTDGPYRILTTTHPHVTKSTPHP